MEFKRLKAAAKDFSDSAKLMPPIKVVGIKGVDLEKSLKGFVEAQTDFDFSTLQPETLDVFDELKCSMSEPAAPAKDNVIPIKKETETKPKKRSKLQQGPALIAAAADVIDILGYPKADLKKFEAMDLVGMVKELQSMAAVINEPYKQSGKTITPDDKPEDFKPETIEVFEANKIKVNWNEPEEETEQKTDTKPDTSKKEKKAPKKKEQPELKFHPYANLFPDMVEDEFNEIVKDMNENGFRADRPVILFSGKIADGKNRYRAANVAGIDCAYTNFDGTEAELFKHVIALNLKRRHLTPAQKATLAVELLPEYEKEAKQKQKAGGKGKKTTEPVRATEQAAKATGSTSSAVSAAKSIKKKAPEKFEEMKQGKKTIASAKRETEEKTAVELAGSSEKVMKAKLRMAQTAIHDYFDAAELAEVSVNNDGDLTLIDDTIQKIINAS